MAGLVGLPRRPGRYWGMERLQAFGSSSWENLRRAALQERCVNAADVCGAPLGVSAGVYRAAPELPRAFTRAAAASRVTSNTQAERALRSVL
jgi:hypothetical protein